MNRARLVRAACVLAALTCFAGPLRNPDLYWHLSAGAAIASARALPRADWLSHTMAGKPWLDFEWLPQLLYLGAWRAGGYVALILLRLLTMAATLGASAALLSLYGCPPAEQGALLLLEACALFPYGDLRPDNFSCLFFALLLLALEAWRLERLRATPSRAAAAAALLFGAWSNMHLGLLYGLALLGLYAAESGASRERRKIAAAALAGAAFGCLLNPFGLRLLEVLPEHFAYMGTLSRTICEWKPARLSSWWVWPFDAVLALSALALGRQAARRRGFPAALAAAWVACAAAALSHERNMSYFILLAVPALWLLAPAAIGPRARAAALLACAAFLGAGVWPFFRGPLAPEMPAAMTDFIAANAEALSGLKLYNGWSDGGYLGWRLAPRWKVFFDGRYLFHGLLEETKVAATSDAAWRALMTRYDVELACMSRSTLHPSFDGLPKDGAPVQVRRPYYSAYMPRARWALVYWDRRDMVFARRDRAPAAWLRAHEYLQLRPDDSERLAFDAVAGLIPDAALDAEVSRHEREAPTAADEGRGLAAWLRALPRRR